MAGATESRTLELVAKIRDQMSPIAKKLGKVLTAAFVRPFKAIARLGRRLLKLKNLLGGVIIAFAAKAGVTALDAIIKKVDDLARLAQTVNDTVENVSRLAFAFKDAGFQGEFLQTMMTAMSRQMSMALNGNVAMVRAFERLGISLEDIRNLGATDLFRKMARGLEQFGTVAEKNSALQVIFADNFRKLQVVLGHGAQAFERALAAGEDFGAVISKLDARVARLYANTLLKLQSAIESVVRSFVTEFGPNVLPIVVSFAKWIAKSKDAVVDFARQVFDVFLVVLDAIAQGFISLIALMEKFPAVFGKIAGQMTAPTGKAKQQLGRLNDELVKLRANLRSLEGQRGELDVSPKGREELEASIRFAKQGIADTERALASMQRQLGTINTSDFLRQQLALIKAQLRKAAAAIRSGVGPAAGPGDAGPGGRLTPPPTSAWGTFWAGFDGHMDNAMKLWGDFAEAGRDAGKVVVRALDGVSNTLVDIIVDSKDAREAFAALSKEILRDLAKMVVKFIVLGIVKGVAGLAQGGITPGVSKTIPIKSYAKGGIARSPQIAVFGEAGEEAFIPLQGGNVPVSLRGGGGGGPTINFFVNAIDAKSFQQVLAQNAPAIWGIVGAGATGASRSLTQTVRGRR